MHLRASLGIAVVLIAASAAPAAAACVYPETYPGDDAPRQAIAGWMAGGAKSAGIPAELPVMASLTDTDLKNLHVGDADSVGYFQMRTPIWNTGEYAGYPEHPTLQRQWFVDQALAVRQQRVAGGDAAYGTDPARWGEWAADVQRPAEQYRGRYQLRLDEARTLVAAGCVEDGGSGGGAGVGTGGTGADPGAADPVAPGAGVPDAQLFPDSVLPALTIKTRARQKVMRTRKLVVTARCGNEGCFTRARGTIAVPGRGLFRLAAPARQMKRGARVTFELQLSRRVHRLVATSLRAGRRPLAAIRVTAANAGGYRISQSRTVLLVAR